MFVMCWVKLGGGSGSFGCGGWGIFGLWCWRKLLFVELLLIDRVWPDIAERSELFHVFVVAFCVVIFSSWINKPCLTTLKFDIIITYHGRSPVWLGKHEFCRWYYERGVWWNSSNLPSFPEEHIKNWWVDDISAQFLLIISNVKLHREERRRDFGRSW